jgi:uncharacterized membrane protein YfhO
MCRGLTVAKDRVGKIELTEYQPNYLKYDFNATSDQFTVFSDIYYEKGWNAYIDGELGSPFQGELRFARHDYSGWPAHC